MSQLVGRVGGTLIFSSKIWPRKVQNDFTHKRHLHHPGLRNNGEEKEITKYEAPSFEVLCFALLRVHVVGKFSLKDIRRDFHYVNSNELRPRCSSEPTAWHFTYLDRPVWPYIRPSWDMLCDFQSGSSLLSSILSCSFILFLHSTIFNDHM